MIFILGNAYQGLITSFMIAQPDLSRLTSFDEVLESGYKVLVADNFHDRMMSYSLYKQAFRSNQVIVSNMNSTFLRLNYHDFYVKNWAVVLECELANHLHSSGLTPDFYLINENFMPHYIQLQFIYLSKFLARWQLIMDWSFEAGLTQAWQKFTSILKLAKVIEPNFDEKPEDILELANILPIFYALIIGCAFGGLVLACEIFNHEFLQPYLLRRKELNDKRRKNKVHPLVVMEAESECTEAQDDSESLQIDEAIAQSGSDEASIEQDSKDPERFFGEKIDTEYEMTVYDLDGYSNYKELKASQMSHII